MIKIQLFKKINWCCEVNKYVFKVKIRAVKGESYVFKYVSVTNLKSIFFIQNNHSNL